MSGWPHLRDLWRSRQSALVLVDDHHRSHGAALGPCRDLGRAKAQFRKRWDVWKVWAKLEEISLGEPGGGGEMLFYVLLARMARLNGTSPRSYLFAREDILSDESGGCSGAGEVAGDARSGQANPTLE